MKTSLRLCVLALALLSPAAARADTMFIFDTVTAFKAFGNNEPLYLAGVLKGSGINTTVLFGDNNLSYQVTRCVPLFLTAMEKPGRYYLQVVVDTGAQFNGLKSCVLEVK